MLAMIIPGNGDAHMTEIWYPYAKRKLEQLGIDVIAKRMPDPIVAHIDNWLPFIKEQIQNSEDVILIGHSSGAVAILRYLEKNRVKGAVLIGAYHTDLDDELEKKSGYFDKPWDWDAIKKNAGWIIQFASLDDPLIPIEEARFVKEHTSAEYHESSNDGHFMGAEFPQLIEAIKNRVNAR